LAGTISVYSKKAIPQLARIAMTIGRLLRVFRCPYQAKVMKMLDKVRRMMVFIGQSCLLLRGHDVLARRYRGGRNQTRSQDIKCALATPRG
jgi:hypothetical protein